MFTCSYFVSEENDVKAKKTKAKEYDQFSSSFLYIRHLGSATHYFYYTRDA